MDGVYNLIQRVKKRGMRPLFESINTQKNYQQIIDQIQRMIMDGTFKNGDKLPPERQITEQLGVSRSSLREALKALEVLGLIESKHGGGSYISNNIGASILKSISIAFRLNGGTVNEILELRYALERESVRILTLKGTDEQIKQLEDIVDRMDEKQSEDEKVRLDIEFHNTLIKNTNNILFQIIADSISELLELFIKGIREIYNNDNENMKTYYFVEQHRNIVNAIKERDPDKAFKVLCEHLQLTDEDLKNLSPDVK